MSASCKRQTACVYREVLLTVVLSSVSSEGGDIIGFGTKSKVVLGVIPFLIKTLA